MGAAGYEREILAPEGLDRVHLVASQLKCWLLGA